MSEEKIRDFEVQDRARVIWWVDLDDGSAPRSFGGDEAKARRYQKTSGGTLQVTRLTEVTYGALYRVVEDQRLDEGLA